MTDPTFDSIRAELPEEATIGGGLVDFFENHTDEHGVIAIPNNDWMAHLVSAIALLEIRLIDLERHVHLGE